MTEGKLMDELVITTSTASAAAQHEPTDGLPSQEQPPPQAENAALPTSKDDGDVGKEDGEESSSKKREASNEEQQDVSAGNQGTTSSGDPQKDARPEEHPTSPVTKKAKIAMPPPVAANLLDVDEYTLDAPPTDENQDDARIDGPNIILFGLHPLVKEQPLKKLCEKYGSILNMGVRSAFASRYGHVEYNSVEEAKSAYKALNGAKLLQKPILVQPTKASPGK